MDNLSINPVSLLFLIIPFALGFYFYARCAKSEKEKDKLILFGLSIFCFAIWFVFLFGFVSKIYSVFYDKY